MFLYSIFDCVMDEFAPPFVAKNDKAACRMFLQGIRKMPSPNDLSLWKVGYFYPESKDEPCVIGQKAVQIPVEMNSDEE